MIRPHDEKGRDELKKIFARQPRLWYNGIRIYARRSVIMSTSIRLSSALERKVRKLARKAGQTQREYLYRLLIEAIEDAEDYQTGIEVLAKINSGEMETIPASEVWSRLGLDD